jgi:hypothetical protein
MTAKPQPHLNLVRWLAAAVHKAIVSYGNGCEAFMKWSGLWRA